MTDSLARLRAAGVSVWLDDLSRERLTTGSLATLRDRGVSGVTTNPTIFAKAISGSDAYVGQIRGLKLRQAPVDQALRELTTSDVRQACDVLRPVYDATGGVDGRVSIEVDPRIAHDPERTVAEARALWWLVDRPNLFVKIPAVQQGLPAISGCLAQGISINVTLIFSLARYAEVIEAFLTGLEGARGAGRDLSGIASVASFFVSRVDTEVDRRLDKISSDGAAALRGKAAIANARLAYQRYEESVSTDRWKSLAAAGARPQRPLWASTSVKDPAYEDTRYVTGLVAPDVVNTMPEATLSAVADHGRIPDDSIHGTYVRGTEPRGLVQLRDLMVCSVCAAASLGVHGNAAVAARNLEPCFVAERSMRQHQPWCSESPTSDILASRIVADSGDMPPKKYEEIYIRHWCLVNQRAVRRHSGLQTCRGEPELLDRAPTRTCS